MILGALLACLLAVTPASAAAPGAGTVQSASAPARTTVLEVQHLFQQLGYPLGALPLGGFGPRTRGALRYFQHKYGLPVTGLPDVGTLRMMQSVAASLRASGATGRGAAAAPRDRVGRTRGKGLPILGLAVVFAALMGLLAVSARERTA
ncbi:MAG: peptidoglycan-binding domain-containing protein [Solirubrobacteraceae bacterium]